MKALGAYIFAGGFTEGVRQHFDVVAHLEETPYGVATAKLNFPDLEIAVGLDRWEAVVQRYRGKVPFVYGNPPCAAWSAMNGKSTVRQQSWRRDDRVSCTLKHFSLLEALKPKVWVWESVDRAFTTGRPFVDELAREALCLGYAVTHLRFDAQYIGGTHRRVRYFFIAHKVAFDWEAWVKFVDAPTAYQVLKKVKPKTAVDRTVPNITAHCAKLHPLTEPGKPLRATYERVTKAKDRRKRVASTGAEFLVGRPGFAWRRLDGDKVLPTLIGCAAMHPDEPRSLNLAEFRAACGYPKTWKTALKRSGQPDWDEFTRAVMPPVGNWLAGLVEQALRQNKRAKKAVTEVDLRDRQVVVYDRTKDTTQETT